MAILRKISASILMAAFGATAALGSYMPAAAGKAEPQGLRWRDGIIKLSISNSLLQAPANIKADSDIAGAVRRAAASWESVADVRFSVEFTDRNSVSPSGNSGDGISLITIAQTPENVLLFSKDPRAEAAKTRVFYNRRGFITEADIVLNPFQQFSADGSYSTFDLEATLVHEIGHLLGLRHSSVLGSTMAGSLPPIGVSGAVSRGLSASDIAAIRDLYGYVDPEASCCSSITGKLNAGQGRPSKATTVWAEDIRTGAVAAVSETSSDGLFRLGGLSSGTYSVFWQRLEDTPISMGSVGTFSVSNGETKTATGRITPERSYLTLDYIGVNGRLSDSAITLTKGREYTVLLGGKGLDPRNIAVEFNSPFLTVRPNSMLEEDFGTGISVISVVIMVHQDTPLGTYSIFTSSQDSAMNALIGAINVQ